MGWLKIPLEARVAETTTSVVEDGHSEVQWQNLVYKVEYLIRKDLPVMVRWVDQMADLMEGARVQEDILCRL